MHLYFLGTSATKPTKQQRKSGVPGMVARILGAAAVVLTEQDELLSLLDRNLDTNFFSASAEVNMKMKMKKKPQGSKGEECGIRRAALDWERAEDTDELLASLQPSSAVSASIDEKIEEGGEGAVAPRRSTRLDFVLCAE